MSEETIVANPVVAGLPESAAAALPKVSADFDVDKFFPGEKPKEAAKPVEKPAEKPVVVSADDAPPTQTLAQKLAAKAKAPEAKAEVKVETAPAPVENPEDKLELDGKASSATRENFKSLK